MTSADKSTTTAEPVYPVKVSPNGRYFVDQNNQPVFWLGTTQWQIFRDQTLEEARTVLAGVKNKGMVFIQAMLAGPGDGTKPNVHGEKPWLNDDPLTPNPAYFQNMDAVIQSAQELNLNFSLTLYHQRWRKIITVENARSWARWLAERYRNMPNIVWSMTPEAKEEFIPVLREMAAGLREGDGGSHLITFKPDPSPYSSSFMHTEEWLDFDSMQTWRDVQLIYPMVTHDYNLKPTKPVLMAEGAYEAGTEYSFDVTPLWTRRQAYYSFLSGAHYTYGHNDSWRMLPTWKQSLDAPGAVQLGLLKQAFLAREEWWDLVPDQSLFASGGNTEGTLLNLAARHKDGIWVMAYLAAPTTVTLDLRSIEGTDYFTALWIDPRTGQSEQIGGIATSNLQTFTTPAGWEDSLLVLEVPGG
jgi:hypothetical protein